MKQTRSLVQKCIFKERAKLLLVALTISQNIIFSFKTDVSLYTLSALVYLLLTTFLISVD